MKSPFATWETSWSWLTCLSTSVKNTDVLNTFDPIRPSVPSDKVPNNLLRQRRQAICLSLLLSMTSYGQQVLILDQGCQDGKHTWKVSYRDYMKWSLFRHLQTLPTQESARYESPPHYCPRTKWAVKKKTWSATKYCSDVYAVFANVDTSLVNSLWGTAFCSLEISPAEIADQESLNLVEASRMDWKSAWN